MRLGTFIKSAQRCAGFLQSTIDNATLNGCLNSLESQGLIKERPPGHFMRVSAKEKAAPMKLVKDEPIHKPEKPMAEKSDELLSAAARIAAAQRKLANEVEEFGLACAKAHRRQRQGKRAGSAAPRNC